MALKLGSINMRQVNDSVVILMAAGAIAVLLVGCASTPPKGAVPPRQTSTDLYDGQKPVIHATEFPVASAPDGIRRGDIAWQQGNLDLAVYMYVQALEFDPNDASTLRKIGAIHESRGNDALALKAFEMAHERGGEHAGTMERLGLHYLRIQRNEEATRLLLRAVALEPDRWRAHNGLGVLADRRGDYAAAGAHYDKAAKLEPRAAIVLNNRGYSRYLAGDLAGAERDLQEAIRLGGVEQAWLNLGRVQAEARRYGKAFTSFLEVLDTARAYNEVGEAALRNGDHLLAKAYFEDAANASPIYFEEAHRNLAIVNEALLGRDASLQ